MKPWYESQLLAVVLGFILGTASTMLATWWQHSLQQKAKAESLKVAFRGEITAIRDALKADARGAFAAAQKGTVLKGYKLSYPRAIYDGHASSLGDLRESVLVGHIAHLYSTLARASDIGRRIEAGSYGGNGPRDFASLLVIAFNQALILDMRLTEQTKHLAELDWSVTVSKADSTDRQFVIDALKYLRPTAEDSDGPTR